MPYGRYDSHIIWGITPDCLFTRVFGINGALPAVAL